MRALPWITLEGRSVRLEPLAVEHVDALVRAASDGRDRYATTFVPEGHDATRAYVEAALAAQAAGDALPFATVDVARGVVVGSTRFGSIERWPWPDSRADRRREVEPDAVEIGWTWLALDAQRTSINTEQKRLLLAHAFEAWGVERVTFITDVRNARSRAAIERIGACFEGVRRAHFPAGDGTIRDSATYSILRAEWPDVRERLDGFLARRPT